MGFLRHLTILGGNITQKLKLRHAGSIHKNILIEGVNDGLVWLVLFFRPRMFKSDNFSKANIDEDWESKHS